MNNMSGVPANNAGLALVGVTQVLRALSAQSVYPAATVVWDSVDLDTLSCWKPGTGLVVVPPNVSMVRIILQLAFDNVSSGYRTGQNVIYNPDGSTRLTENTDYRAATNETGSSCISRMIKVTPGEMLGVTVTTITNPTNLQGTGFGGPSYAEYEWYR